MKKRYSILAPLLLLAINFTSAQQVEPIAEMKDMYLPQKEQNGDEGQFYIYGECILVSKDTVKGFLSLNDDKLWVSQFKASKLENPYTKLFGKNREILFGELAKPTPDIHTFSCRYNSIRQLRPIAHDRLEVTIKDGRSIDLKYDFSANPIMVHKGDSSQVVDWQEVSYVEFSQSTEVAPSQYGRIYVGEVKSTQGVYYGIIERLNYRSRDIQKVEFTDLRDIYFNLDSITNLETEGGREITIPSGRYSGKYKKCNGLTGVEVHLPSVGSIYIPWQQLRAINRKPTSELKGTTYNNSQPIERLVATIILKNEKTVSGAIAYDLDEVLNIELLNGKNDNIIYNILFEQVAVVEPRNYMYSLITLKNGGRLSIGDSQDVTSHNNGILMLESNTYIPWSEIQTIEFK